MDLQRIKCNLIGIHIRKEFQQQLSAEHIHHPCKHCHGHQTSTQGEPERFLHTGILLCPVIEGRYRLESLADAQCHTKYEIENTGHHAHSGDGNISVDSCLCIQHHGGHAVQSLPHHTGEACGNNILMYCKFPGKIFRCQATLGLAPQEKEQQNPKGYVLGDHSGKCRSPDAKI